MEWGVHTCEVPFQPRIATSLVVSLKRKVLPVSVTIRNLDPNARMAKVRRACPPCSKGYAFDSGPGVGTGEGSQLRSKALCREYAEGEARVSARSLFTPVCSRQSRVSTQHVDKAGVRSVGALLTQRGVP